MVLELKLNVDNGERVSGAFRHMSSHSLEHVLYIVCTWIAREFRANATPRFPRDDRINETRTRQLRPTTTWSTILPSIKCYSRCYGLLDLRHSLRDYVGAILYGELCEIVMTIE